MKGGESVIPWPPFLGECWGGGQRDTHRHKKQVNKDDLGGGALNHLAFFKKKLKQQKIQQNYCNPPPKNSSGGAPNHTSPSIPTPLLSHFSSPPHSHEFSIQPQSRSAGFSLGEGRTGIQKGRLVFLIAFPPLLPRCYAAAEGRVFKIFFVTLFSFWKIFMNK